MSLVEQMDASIVEQKRDLIASATPEAAFILEGFTYDQLTQIQRFVRSYSEIEKDMYPY